MTSSAALDLAVLASAVVTSKDDDTNALYRTRRAGPRDRGQPCRKRFESSESTGRFCESLLALEGTVRFPMLPCPLPDVVVVDDELVELQATAVAATTETIVSAAKRVFHDAEPKAPP